MNIFFISDFKDYKQRTKAQKDLNEYRSNICLKFHTNINEPFKKDGSKNSHGWSMMIKPILLLVVFVPRFMAVSV